MHYFMDTLLPRRDVNETRETRKNFSVSSIEFLAVEKCDKQLDDDRPSFNDGRDANPPAGGLRVSWESVTRVDGN